MTLVFIVVTPRGHITLIQSGKI